MMFRNNNMLVVAVKYNLYLDSEGFINFSTSAVGAKKQVEVNLQYGGLFFFKRCLLVWTLSHSQQAISHRCVVDPTAALSTKGLCCEPSTHF